MGPIGIFDSGVGGLTVLGALRESFLNVSSDADFLVHYLCDNQFFPYGEKAEQVVEGRVLSMFTRFWQQKPFDVGIIACNTASTIVLPALRAAMNIPIIGVVPPVKPAAPLTNSGIIGLLATKATVKRPYIKALIEEFGLGQRFVLVGSSLLVQMAEEKVAGRKVDLGKIASEISHLLELDGKMDVLILGCTHFPILQEEILSLFQSKPKILEPAQPVAAQVLRVMGLYVKEELSTNNRRCSPLRGGAVILTEASADWSARFKDSGFSDISILKEG
jgi:glutamate racemase